MKKILASLVLILCVAAAPNFAFAQVGAAPGGGGGGSTGGNANSGEGGSWDAETEDRYDAARDIREQIKRHKRAQEERPIVEAEPERKIKPKPVAKKRKKTPRRKITRIVPLPHLPPLRTFGRRALLDAPFKPKTIVALLALETEAQAEGFAKSFDMNLVKHAPIETLQGALVELSLPDDLSAAMATQLLLKNDQVLGAQPAYLFEVQQSEAPSASPLKDLQYAPNRMALSAAHKLSLGEDITIAVIDTGVDLEHGEFTAQNFRHFDAVDDGQSTAELHGTAMAGVIAATGNMLGVAPGAEVLAIRAFAESADGRFLSDSFTIARAIDWAVINGADILNMSFAGPADPLLLKLMDELARRDLLMVAAAGNQGPDAPAAYPAAHKATIAVTATDDQNALYQNANRGRYVTIAAPGVDIIAPAPGNAYEMSSGTSIATAHVAGVIALMLSGHEGLQTADVIKLLEASATDYGSPGKDVEFGLGLIDAHKAILRTAAAAQ